MNKLIMLGGHNGGARQFDGSRATFDGNSLTYGGYPLFVGDLFESFGVDVEINNIGVNGQTTQMMIDDAATEVDDNWVIGKPNLLVAYEIGNDLSQNADVAGACARFQAYCEGRRDAAIDNGINLKIVVLTCTPRNTISDDLFNPCNQFLKDNYLEFSNGLADLRTDPRLLSTNNTVYYQDGVHYTDAGKAIVAKIVFDSIRRL